jgi:hypothetical protein
VVNGLMAAISETVMFVLCVETKKSNKCVGAKRSKMLRQIVYEEQGVAARERNLK